MKVIITQLKSRPAKWSFFEMLSSVSDCKILTFAMLARSDLIRSQTRCL